MVTMTYPRNILLMNWLAGRKRAICDNKGREKTLFGTVLFPKMFPNHGKNQHRQKMAEGGSLSQRLLGNEER